MLGDRVHAGLAGLNRDIRGGMKGNIGILRQDIFVLSITGQRHGISAGR